MDRDDHYVVISTDCHAGASMNDYRAYLDPRFREEFDAWRGDYKNPFRDLLGSKRYRNWDSDARIREQEADGVVAEVLYPNTVPPFFPSMAITARPPATRTEYERRWAGIQAHNRWMADFCALAPERRAGIAQILLNDVDDAVREIRWARDHGLRGGVLLPGIPPDVDLPPFYAPDYEPIWSVCEELDMVVNHHSGNGTPSYGRYPQSGVLWLVETGYFSHRPLWHLMFGGVFEKHPKMKFVLAEAGSGWVADTLPSLDAQWRSVRTGRVGELGFGTDEMVPRPPSEYFARQCWLSAPFMRRSECERRYEIGVDRLMWGTDYPHDEGTYPYSRESLRHTFHDVPAEELRSILATTAADLYDFDLEALGDLAQHCGPTVADVATPLDAVPDGCISPAFATV